MDWPAAAPVFAYFFSERGSFVKAFELTVHWFGFLPSSFPKPVGKCSIKKTSKLVRSVLVNKLSDSKVTDLRQVDCSKSIVQVKFL